MSANRPEVVHQVDGWWTIGGRFPDIASLRSTYRPLRGRWVDVFRTAEEGRPTTKRVDRLPNLEIINLNNRCMQPINYRY